jgi:integrase
MAKSSKSATRRKPAKPRPDFPLFPHASGRWAKKVLGQLKYFGKVADDPKGEVALKLWLERRDDLLAGRKPRPKVDGVTVADACNRFLNAKRRLLDNGEIKPRTFYEYHWDCEQITTSFGRNRAIVDLSPDDFEQLRANLAKVRGPVSLGNEINRCRMVFKFAFDEGMIDRPVRYGQSFRRPSRKTLRIERAAKGPRMFDASELRQILDAAGVPMKAFVFLGVNCGFGQTDIANLPLSAIDLDHGWIDFPRPKTGISRRVPLWPETIAAVRAAIESRREPKDPQDVDLAFLTARGQRWVRTYQRVDTDERTGAKIDRGSTPDDAIGKEFAKLLARMDKAAEAKAEEEGTTPPPRLKRPGRAFYALRHGFETIGGEAKDQVAMDAIMGHADESMAARYREGISDERLRAVVDHVRVWLFPHEVDAEDQEPATLKFPSTG